MKIRKVLSVFLAIIMLTGCLSTMPVSAEGENVYKVGTGGDYATIDEAIEAINGKQGLTEATIELKSAQSVGGQEKSHTAKIKYTGASITLTASFFINGPVEFDNITLSGSGKSFFANGKTLIIGSNVSTSGINLSCAGSGADVASTDVTIKSGSWSNVYTNGQYNGNVNGKSQLIVEGDSTSIQTLWIGGAWDYSRNTYVKGSTDVTIKGGTISNIHIGVPDANGGRKVIFGNGVNVKVNGGSIASSARFGTHYGNTGLNEFQNDSGVVIDFSDASYTTAIGWLDNVKTVSNTISETKYYTVKLPTAYVSASAVDDSKDGFSYDTAVASINGAIGKINTLYNVIASAQRVDLKSEVMMKLVGKVTQSTNESAHENITIIYIGYDASSELVSEASFRCGGPVVFKDLKLTSASTRYIYAHGYKLVMDTGLTMTNKTYNVYTEYNSTNTFSDIDITVKSGKYNEIGIANLSGCTVTGDVNVLIEGADTTIKTLYIGSAWATAQNTFEKDVNVTINEGTLTNVIIGSGKTGVTQFKGDVSIKIKDAVLSGDFVRFGAYVSTDSPVNYYYKNTVFEGKCLIDFSNTNAANYNAWKTALNAEVTAKDEAYHEAFQIYETKAVGAQVATKANDDGSVNIRFLAGLRAYEDVKEAGFEITATVDGEIIAKFDKSVANVYDSITENSEKGQTTKTATEIGANFITALTIKGVPTNEGAIEFEIKPYTIAAGSDVRVYGLSDTVTYNSTSGN